jgi:hypothetical protein
MTVNEVIASLGGNVILLAAVGWLIKTLLSHRFSLEAEKFKVEVKAAADAEIERVRAFLARASHVHERQVDTLIKLHQHLQKAQQHLQSMTRSGRFEGEPSVDEYHKLWAEALGSAHDVLLEGGLLIPLELAQQCDRFFDALFEGQRYFAIAERPEMINALQRAEFRKKAQTVAGQEVPNLLEQIDKAGRNVIHGESTHA